jgi:PD-(D/E)XK nuclease superfamily
MGLSDSRPGPPLGYVFPRAVGFGYPFPALPGLPGSSTDLFLRAVPNHPGRSDECLLIASPPISGFIIFGRLATSTQRHEAESGSLALRLAGLLPRFPPDGLLRLAPVQLHVRTSNLHGELLSVHKIEPGLAWCSKAAKPQSRQAAKKRRKEREIIADTVTENELAKQIVDAAYRVHTTLGPGLLESVYESVLAYELEHRGLLTIRQQPVPLVYHGVHLISTIINGLPE